jgi:hypothetical protein
MEFFADSPISLVYNLPELPSSCTDQANIGKGCLMLSQEMIVGIFNGTIKKWNDPLILARNKALASVNETIVVVVRADGSGTTGIFTRALATFNPNWNKEKSQQFTDGIFLSKPEFSVHQIKMLIKKGNFSHIPLRHFHNFQQGSPFRLIQENSSTLSSLLICFKSTTKHKNQLLALLIFN